MKIDNSLNKASGVATGNIENKAAKNNQASKTEKNASSSEKVTLSAQSTELQSMEAKRPPRKFLMLKKWKR